MPTKTEDHTKETFAFPGLKPQPIMFMPDSSLKAAYKRILADPESGGVYEPVAEGIRIIWQRRGRNPEVLRSIDRRFKNLKRRS